MTLQKAYSVIFAGNWVIGTKVAVGNKPIGTLFSSGQNYTYDIVLESWRYYDSNNMFEKIYSASLHV